MDRYNLLHILKASLRAAATSVPQEDVVMINKQYDLFVSYSHSDSELVLRLASALHVRRVRLWFDRWAMKPGDILRERIGEGIVQASYFLVVLSPQSLSSNWVRYELNASMIGEIEQGRVRVIPALAPGAEFDMLPPDLQMKYCLDLRSVESFSEAVDSIVDLVQPEVRLRRELLKRLRNPKTRDHPTVAELREYANRPSDPFRSRVGPRDQAIQIAALRGLAKIPGIEATLAVTERSLSTWGMKAIEVALGVLAKRYEYGGYCVLAASFLYDFRFRNTKADYIIGQLKRMNDQRAASTAHQLLDIKNSRDPQRIRLKRIISTLETSHIDDLRHGAIICRLHDSQTNRDDRLRKPSQSDIDIARRYSEERLPGFFDMLNRVYHHEWALYSDR